MCVGRGGSQVFNTNSELILPHVGHLKTHVPQIVFHGQNRISSIKCAYLFWAFEFIFRPSASLIH